MPVPAYLLLLIRLITMPERLDVSPLSEISDYGKLIQLPTGVPPTFEDDSFKYWKQQAKMYLNAPIEIGVLQVEKQILPFNQMERHYETQELLVPLTGDILIPMAKNNDRRPDSREIKIFQISQGQALLLDKNCWHWMPRPCGKQVLLLVIFKDDTSANDLIIETLSTDCLMPIATN